MGHDLTIELVGDDRDRRVVLAGDLDLAARPPVDAALREACAGARSVVVDVAGVTFMDSSGLNALVVANRYAGEQDVELSVSSPPAQVRRLFELTGTSEFLKVVDL